MLRIFALALAALAIASFRPVLAFDGGEHEKIGNLGMQIALAHMRAKYADRAGVIAAAERLAKRPGKYDKPGRDGLKEVSYGDITACVDYFLYPQMLLVDIRTNEARPDKPPLLDLSLCRGYGHRNFLQATRSNHSHFQLGALLSYQTLHDAALQAARRGEFFHALVLNAVADHYLEDFMAPGHVRTNRRALSDVVATAIHDGYNENETGVRFQPNLEKLAPLAGYLCAGAQRDPCELAVELEALKRPNEDAAQVGAALTALMDAREPFVGKGDDSLWEGTHEQRKQRIFIVLMVARSILDVLLEEQSFTQPVWEQEGNEPQTARMAYGEYQLSAFGGRTTAYLLPDWSNVIGLSVAREQMTKHGRAGRTAFTAEWAWAVATTSDKLNLIPVVGYTCYMEGSVNGCGPVARLSYVWPQTEIAIGAYTRWLSYPYPEGGRDTRRWSAGLRADMGFSSYITLFVAGGRDWATSPERGLERGNVLMAGVEFLFPLSAAKNGLARYFGMR